MAQNILDSLKDANLVPSKVIPADFTPTFHLNVHFPTKAISNGTLVRVSEVKQTPSISISAISPTTTTTETPEQSFTFMLIDPDAPTPDDPKFGYWRHWVVTNIPFSSPTTSKQSEEQTKAASMVDTGRTLTQYLPPGPKDESGPHRYLFLLFAEPEQRLKLEKSDVGGEEFVERRSFRAEEFVQRHGLRLVGVQWMRGVGDGWKGPE
ncbi:PEBP-like protein [Parathielavia appendiculata]|uniref:PEBP-like protein n=1 Tax=Parathielavia appendiculata TaxID=2587402 RepID=A0AAN6Z4X5_9PEZI|nr:PEBP-like protein [Parathielavia appendiculata]